MTDPHHGWVDPNPPNSDPIDSRATVILAVSGVLLTVLVVTTLIGVVLSTANKRTPGASGGEVTLVAANDPTDDPFTRSIIVAPVVISDEAIRQSLELLRQIPVRASRGARTVSGLQTELYGTTGEVHPCDVVTLANYLDVDPDLAATWGLALGLTPQQLPYYINTLTPVVLMIDTWVTTHSFNDGAAVPKQAVLQAGNAVLIDPVGVPRVHCASGAPLVPPANSALMEYRLSGDAWPEFDAHTVVAIDYAASNPQPPGAEFTLIDIGSGQEVIRKAGGIIDLAGATVPLPDPSVMNIPPGASVQSTPVTAAAPAPPAQPAAPATPPPIPDAPYEPIRNCGPLPTLANLDLINYNVDAISCPEAIDVMTRFHQAQQKHATVDDWACSVLGAADAERRAHVINCRGPRGELRAEAR